MYKRILVPLDGSATAERGLREAIGLAAEQKSRLFLLHVVDEYPLVLQMSSALNHEQTERASLRMTTLREYGDGLLAKAGKLAADAGVAADTRLREISSGRIADVIVEEAALSGCDLIVMGTHGRRGFSRLMLGSDAELVVRTAGVPVLLVRQEEARS
jgi:nucleotide-binding universal stress UspA family protein